MARVERYPGQPSEYGGGDGTPQRHPDGTSLDLPGIASATGERARLLRTAGMADFDPAEEDLVGLARTGLNTAGMSFARREAYEADLAVSAGRALERERLNDRTNGYVSEPEQYMGDGVS